jgi:hypothetical protein
MSLSRIEQETIILFNEADKAAIIDTCNTALTRRMDKYCAEDKLCCLVKKDQYGAKYVCPKSWVKVQRPRQLSEEQRREFAVRARHNFGWEQHDYQEQCEQWAQEEFAARCHYGQMGAAPHEEYVAKMDEWYAEHPYPETEVDSHRE